MKWVTKPKKFEIIEFHSMRMVDINSRFLGWTLWNILRDGGNFIFSTKFLSFKGVSPRNVWRNPKNLKSSSFKVWWWEILIQDSQDEHCGIFWGMGEIFNFWTKFLSFKGVSPRNEWRTPKKLKFFDFEFVMKGGINTTLSGWTLWKNLNGGENFQILDEILEF